MREFAFSDKDFQMISECVYKSCGIVLGPHKKEMVYSRIARRIRATEHQSFKEYLKSLDEKDIEFSNFINAVTTNLTSFFREQHHFDYLCNTIIPQLLESNKNTKRVRIWSAGCSTGEEPYSIAMTIKDRFPALWDVKILATDLDSNVLEKAYEGVYKANNMNGLDALTLQKWFTKSTDRESLQVSDELKRLIHFKRLNLIESWPMKGQFDVIFCRNVLIYFDKKTKEQLFNNFFNYTINNGYLFIGHSETIGKDNLGFQNMGKTMYQKNTCE